MRTQRALLGAMVLTGSIGTIGLAREIGPPPPDFDARTDPAPAVWESLDGTGNILIRITTDRRGDAFTTGLDQIRIVAVP